MLEDSGAVLVLSQQSLRGEVPTHTVPLMLVDTPGRDEQNAPAPGPREGGS
jgi:hypothetical protein